MTIGETRKALAAALGAIIYMAADLFPSLGGVITPERVEAAAVLLTPVLVWLVPNVLKPGMAEKAEDVAQLAREAVELRRRAAVLLAAGATNSASFADLPSVQREAARLVEGVRKADRNAGG